MAKKLTSSEQRQFKEMVEIFGGENAVDKGKIKTRILSKRKRKTNKITRRDMEEMFGY